jgi:hypothetical protein
MHSCWPGPNVLQRCSRPPWRFPNLSNLPHRWDLLQAYIVVNKIVKNFVLISKLLCGVDAPPSRLWAALRKLAPCGHARLESVSDIPESLLSQNSYPCAQKLVFKICRPANQYETMPNKNILLFQVPLTISTGPMPSICLHCRTFISSIERVMDSWSMEYTVRYVLKHQCSGPRGIRTLCRT